jgi:hypothetical protein
MSILGLAHAVLTDENGKPSFIQHYGQPTGEKEQVALHQPHGNASPMALTTRSPVAWARASSRRRLSCSALKVGEACNQAIPTAS